MNGLRADLQLEEEILFGMRPRVEPPRPAPSSLPVAPAGLAGLRRQAEADAGRRFISLLHYVDVELLKSAYQLLKIEGARGGGGRTWHRYGVDLDANTVRLYAHLQRRRLRTLPPWRRMVAVAQGRREPLKSAVLRERIVQRAFALVLSAIYEPGLMAFARTDARTRLTAQLDGVKPRWVVDAPIGRYHETLQTKFLVRSLEHRIGDHYFLDLLDHWIDAGLLQEATVQDEGTAPFNALASLLVDIYYHYGFDTWADRWRQRHARSAVILLRDAHELLAVFEHKPGARRFQVDLRARFKQFMPGLPAKKIRLSGFERHMREGSQSDDEAATVVIAR